MQLTHDFVKRNDLAEFRRNRHQINRHTTDIRYTEGIEFGREMFRLTYI